jgi:uncharacterized membrane protein YadS
MLIDVKAGHDRFSSEARRFLAGHHGILLAVPWFIFTILYLSILRTLTILGVHHFETHPNYPNFGNPPVAG